MAALLCALILPGIVVDDARAANDLAVDEDFLWIATNGGLVRFRLDAIRP